jgi:type II secretory pathway component PulJ
MTYFETMEGYYGIEVSSHMMLDTEGIYLGLEVRKLMLCGDIESNPGPPRRRGGHVGSIATESTIEKHSSANSESEDAEEAGILRSISRDVKAINKKMDNFTKEFQQLKQRVTVNEQKYNELEDENTGLKQRINQLEMKAEHQEAQSRRDNLLFRGIPEDDDETWEDTEKKVKAFLEEKMDIDSEMIEFERVHRLNTRTNNTPRPIIAKFSKYKDRNNVLMKSAGKLNKTDYRVSEDFTKNVREIRTKLSTELMKARDDGKTAKLRYDKLIIDGKKYVYDQREDRVKELQ